MEETIGDRLRKYRKSKGMKSIDFAKKVGISRNVISEIENKRVSPSGDTLQKIIKYSNIPPRWLVSGEGTMIEGEDENVASVQVLTYAGLGDPCDLENQKPLKTISLPREFVAKNGKVIDKAVICKGDSMYPTIVDEAVVGVDFEDCDPVENKIFLFRLEYFGLTIKRLRITMDGYLLVADNSMIKDELITKDQIEQGVIVGRVRWVHNRI